jgi:hypothetical protein
MTDTFMQTIINRIRHGDIAALTGFYQYVLDNHQDSKDFKDNLIAYAAFEFLPTNLNELDIILAKLIQDAIFENKKIRGHFIGDENKQIRDGAMLFFRSVIFTYHLKEEKITTLQLANKEGKLDLNGAVQEAYHNNTWRIFIQLILPELMIKQPFTPQRKRIDKGISEFIKKQQKAS